MKTGGGDFSAEAYEQMRNAYDKEQQRQVDDEVKGTQLMGMEYGLETMPVDSPWKDKIENWTYPTGKGQYLDERQSPDEVLQVMRDAAQARIDARNAEVAEEEDDAEADEEVDEVLDDEDLNIAQMTEEEFDAYIASILEEADDEDEETQDEDEDEEEDNEEDGEVDEEETQEEEKDEDEDAPEANDEGGDAEVEAEEDEDEGENESEEDVYDPEDIAAQIAELRAEIENMQFVPTQEDDEPQ